MLILQMCDIFVGIHELGQVQLCTSVPFLGVFNPSATEVYLVIVFVGVVEHRFSTTYSSGMPTFGHS